MKLMIVGSRSIKSFDLAPYVPKSTKLIISGGAEGVDKIAEQYVDKNKISKLILRPEYRTYGKAAPLKRNELMADIADEVIVIWDGCSKGSEYTIEYVKKTNKRLTLLTAEAEKKKRGIGVNRCPGFLL